MVHSSSLRAVWVAIVILQLAFRPGILKGQQPPGEVPPITIRANTRLVLVDVVVTDKKGQPVTGLRVENFTVEENGKKQKIATFVAPGRTPSATQASPPGVLSNRPELLKPVGVPTVLLLDAANSHFLDQAYGRNQMLKYVLQQSQAGKPMAVMTLTDRLRVLQNFTSDPRVLTAAIKKILPQEQILQPGLGLAPSNISSSDLGGGPGTATEAAIATAQADIASFQNLATGYVLERRTLITVQALRDLARILGGFEGRKNVVWLTGDFPFDLIPQDTNVSEEELAADLPSVRQKNVSTLSTGSLASEQRQSHFQEIRQAEFALASSGIAIYPVDMRGIMMSGIDVNTTFALRELAAETGGKPYVNQNEIKDGIARPTKTLHIRSATIRTTRSGTGSSVTSKSN